MNVASRGPEPREWAVPRLSDGRGGRGGRGGHRGRGGAPPAPPQAYAPAVVAAPLWASGWGASAPRHGVTLIELMIVLAIIATLSSIGAVRYVRSIQKAEETVATEELRDLFDEILFYEQALGELPHSLLDLGRGEILDPWGNPYQFLNFADIGKVGGGGAGGGGQAANGSGGNGANGGSGKGNGGNAKGGNANGGNANGGNAGAGNAGGLGEKRKDRFVVPLNTRFDLYSMGPDGKSVAPLTAAHSRDDIVVANDGDYIGLASLY